MGDFFIPDLGLELSSYLLSESLAGVHHLVRVQWALAVFSDPDYRAREILDVTCGAGYGSFMIARAHPEVQVRGVDADAEAIAYAKEHFQLPNLTFAGGDVLRWRPTIGPSCIDAMVSFDTLEHVPHREIMMQNVVDHLSPGGISAAVYAVRRRHHVACRNRATNLLQLESSDIRYP